MIFLTVGTTSYPFPRLLKVVDDSLSSLHIKEKLVAQVGVNRYNLCYKPILFFSDLSFYSMRYYISRARVIICHGGIGSLLMSLRYGKTKPFVVPRQKNFCEHVDNHQEQLCLHVFKKNIIQMVPINSQGETLTTGLADYLRHPQQSSPFNGTNLKILTTRLISYSESLR